MTRQQYIEKITDYLNCECFLKDENVAMVLKKSNPLKDIMLTHTENIQNIEDFVFKFDFYAAFEKDVEMSKRLIQALKHVLEEDKVLSSIKYFTSEQ